MASGRLRPVTVVLRHNETLELNLIEYAGAISDAQLMAVAAFGAHRPSFLKRDALNIVRANASFALDLTALDALFERYRTLYAPLSFQIYRRAAWLCLSKAAEPYVDYWLGERDLRGAMSSTVRKFDALAEAAEWLLLSSAELALVESGEGFSDVAYFEDVPLRAARR
jgi:hypothetical protein